MVDVAHGQALEWDTPLFRQARAQLEQALLHADVPEAVAERLRHPERSVILTLPVLMDDGSLLVFDSWNQKGGSCDDVDCFREHKMTARFGGLPEHTRSRFAPSASA